MNLLDFQAMPAPFGGVGGNLFVGQAIEPLPQNSAKVSGPPITQVIREVVAAKLAGNRRPAYVRNLKVVLNQFARGREDKPVSEFTMSTLEEWFDSRNETPATRKGIWGRISVLFSYAKKKKYITENPASGMDRARVDARVPRIFTPAEAEKILRHLSGHARRRLRLAQVVIGLFAGVRPTELTRLRWSDIDLERAVIRVDASASKTHQRRIVPLSPNAVEWLKLCPRTDKPIGAIRWKWISDIERGTGVKWSNDVLRHSCASYSVAKFEDVGKVSRWLGNSPTILLRHYTEIVGKEDCEAYWNIRPSMEPQDNLFTRAERGDWPSAVSTANKIKFIIKHGDAALLARVRAGWTCVSDAWDECSSLGAWEPM